MKAKVNDTVKFKANSLGNGTVKWLPDEDEPDYPSDNMYTIELVNGNTIRCTEQYFEVVEDEEEEQMTRKEVLKQQNDFSIYGVFRFTAYLVSSIALYMGNLQIAGIALGFGATLGFIRRIARIWE